MNHTQNNQNNRLELNHGYTLIEVMIAMAIFAIGILAIFSMQITSTGSNALARGLTENYTAAMDKVEELLALPYDDPDLDPDAGANPHELAADDDGISRFGSFHSHWGGHLVTAPEGGGDHWPPAAGSGLGDDGAAIGYWTEHGNAWPHQTAGECNNTNGSLHFPIHWFLLK